MPLWLTPLKCHGQRQVVVLPPPVRGVTYPLPLLDGLVPVALDLAEDLCAFASSRRFGLAAVSDGEDACGWEPVLDVFRVGDLDW